MWTLLEMSPRVDLSSVKIAKILTLLAAFNKTWKSATLYAATEIIGLGLVAGPTEGQDNFLGDLWQLAQGVVW